MSIFDPEGQTAYIDLPKKDEVASSRLGPVPLPDGNGGQVWGEWHTREAQGDAMGAEFVPIDTQPYQKVGKVALGSDDVLPGGRAF